MKKDNYRDYVVDAMRYYAMCKKPDEATLRRLRNVLPPDDTACYRDLEAVQHMLKRLESEEYGRAGVRCVEIVYFASPSRALSRNDITLRVCRAASELSICETNVYRALRRARTLVAIERGLRVDDRSILMTRYTR